MLSALYIENIAVIEKASIDFENGLTVLTGETGAGKSIIIDAINAVIGERTSKDLIRTGTDGASVSALFTSINDKVKAALDTQGIPGVLMWIAILSVAFVAVGFLFFGLDRLGKKLAEKP